jgi:hypothetical protein
MSRISIAVDDKVAEKLREYARLKYRPLATLVSLMCRAYVEDDGVKRALSAYEAQLGLMKGANGQPGQRHP